MEAIRAKLEEEQRQHSTNIHSKEDLDAHLREAAERKAAIDQERSDLAGQEVTFAKAIAAEQKEAEATHTDPRTGLTKSEIEHQLQLAAERKKHFDDERALKAGAEVQHVREVVEHRKQAVETLHSEKEQLDAQLKTMDQRQKELEERLEAPIPDQGLGFLSADGRPVLG